MICNVISELAYKSHHNSGYQIFINMVKKKKKCKNKNKIVSLIDIYNFKSITHDLLELG